MKQVVSLHVGQAGCQIGQACWDRLSKEHSLDSEGHAEEPAQEDIPHLLFHETKNGYTPRCIFTDLESTVIDEIRTGQIRRIFGPDQFTGGKQDAAGNWSRAQYTLGKCQINQDLDKIRRMVEKCDHFEGFMLTHSINGGTGGGYTSLLLQRLSVQYSKKPKICHSVFPSPNMASQIVQPYNNVLSLNHLLEHEVAVIPYDNQKLYSICSSKLNVEQPSYSNINRMIAKVFSTITAPMRFNGALDCDLRGLLTNLIPYHRIKFLLPSYGPFQSADQARHTNSSLFGLTKQCLTSEGTMVSCHPERHKSVASWVNYQGDVTPTEACSSLQQMKSRQYLRTLPWCPTGTKVTLTDAIINPKILAMGQPRQGCCMLTNSSAIERSAQRIGSKFDRMFSMRGFVYWFIGEGMESNEFQCCREETARMLKDYEQIQSVDQEEQVLSEQD